MELREKVMLALAGMANDRADEDITAALPSGVLTVADLRELVQVAD